MATNQDNHAVEASELAIPPHKLEIDQIFDEWDGAQQGLNESQASERLKRYGRNRIGQQHQVSAWEVILHQFQSPLIYVLLGALVLTTGISLFTTESRWSDAIVIGMVLVVNGTVGFLQEYRAEHAVAALMKMVAPKATVRRENTTREVDAETIVPGDVVILNEGRVVPADVRLMEVQSLQVNEAALTGESVPVNKSDQTMANSDDHLPPADQNNMAFMGTAVTAGHAAGIVVATGRQTQIGQIAQQVEKAGETQTPLQRRIHQLAIWITWGILSIAIAASLVGWMMGRSWAQMLTLAVALAVAAIPAGLPIVVTVALAIGVRRMAKLNAVIRHLPAVDTLGSCTTIVSDKTGTLTQNRMAVKSICAGGDEYEVTGEAYSHEGTIRKTRQTIEPGRHRPLYETLLAGVLCNNATIPDNVEANHEDGRDESRPSGDPMEIALLYAGLKAGMKRKELDNRYHRIDEVPFRTERRFMAVVVVPQSQDSKQNEPMVLVKGAPEAVLNMCTQAQSDNDHPAELNREQILSQNETMAGQGLRVLAMAVGQGDEMVKSIKSDEPDGLTYVGMQGLQDPPRSSAVKAVDDSHQAGIRVMMVTGDHGRTASAIAHQIHVDQPIQHQTPATTDIGDPENRSSLAQAVSGQDISDWPDDKLDEALDRTNVFARVKPTQKTRIVDRLKARNQVVAVTGDGVNDAPALKGAHIGAAMGSGTDVAKEASDMVISDDNFASVYQAVEQGRTAFRNIRMATFFLLSTGAADVLIILTALGLDWPLPLLPAQILWCNVVTNGIADVALAFEPGETALYRRPPRPPSEGILDARLLERLVLIGIWLSVGVLGVFLWKWGFNWQSWTGDSENLTIARTAALTTLVLFQKVHVFNCRSEDVSIFKKSLLANKVLLIGVMASLAVHIAAIYWPVTQKLLSLAPMSPGTWVIATVVALTAIIVNELHKKMRPRTR